MARSYRSSATEYEQWRRQQEREAERQRKAVDAAQRALDRANREHYQAARLHEAERLTAELHERVSELRTLLVRGLSRSARLDLERLRRQVTVPPFDPGQLGWPLPQPDWSQFDPPQPSVLGRFFGGDDRYQRRLDEARGEFERARAVHAQLETNRQHQLADLQRQHDARVAEAQQDVDEHNRAIEEFADNLRSRDQQAVERYLGMVLSAVPLPSGFPRTGEVTYNPLGEQAAVRFELPGPEVVPTTREVQYIKSKDDIRELTRPGKEIAELYRLVVSQVALLCVRDIFESDSQLATLAFNGHVRATNPATGHREYPCLISLNIEREALEELVLRDVRPEVCLRHLRALISPHPYDLEPIKPIVDFDLTKYRFVEGLDAVSTLDSRPDLMDLSPDEFEHLVRQVFEAAGLEGWTTQHSRDDGVDAVMINRTPGRATLTIVQAKRYSKVVGVNHIRELAGAMEEKKAGHGILVTTSWFTAGCWQKAWEHGRMELFDGPRLRSLIQERLGKDVLIGVNRPVSAATGPVKSTLPPASTAN
jgi:restriction system protein